MTYLPEENSCQEPEEDHNYEKDYSDSGFWDKIMRFFIAMTEKAAFVALQLYYTLLEPATPAWAKSVITGALGYLIMPIDAISDFLPGGYTDDIGALALAAGAVIVHITPAIKEKAVKKLEELKRTFSK
jgi:uncharacterized membrane protein YkvA (DUF1232 family)